MYIKFDMFWYYDKAKHLNQAIESIYICDVPVSEAKVVSEVAEYHSSSICDGYSTFIIKPVHGQTKLKNALNIVKSLQYTHLKQYDVPLLISGGAISSSLGLRYINYVDIVCNLMVKYAKELGVVLSDDTTTELTDKNVLLEDGVIIIIKGKTG